MSVGDIHNRNGRIEKTVKSIEGSGDISERNKELLEEFQSHLEAQDLSKDRIARYLYNWYQLSEYIDWELDEVSKSDLKMLVGDINQDKVRNKELSPYTKMEYKKAIRKFYTDFLPSDYKIDYEPEKLCDFFSLTVNTNNTDPDRLPTPNTVRELVKQADHIRDRALIMTLWSSAGRIGEVLGLQWKDVSFDSEVAKVRFRDTKSGGSRKVPLRAGYKFLKDLRMSDHRSDEPDAFVFRNKTNDNQMSHSAACNILRNARDDADIPERKKTNPHAFRKGRATYLAAQGMNQAQLCAFGGWAQGSSHVAKYIRMAESDVEHAIKQVSGLEDQGKEVEDDLLPIQCHMCGELNRFEATSCSKCDAELSTSKMFEESEIEEATEKLVFEVARSEANLDRETIEEKAKELVEDEFSQ